MNQSARRPLVGALPATAANDDERAHRLAGLLRSSRLTVLYADERVGPHGGLAAAVLPLLGGRLARTPGDGAPLDTVTRFPDLNDAPSATLEHEAAVHLDDWSAPPWPRLQAVVRQALNLPPAAAPSRLGLTQTLGAWTRRRRTRLLVILDRFEDCLHGAASRPDLRAFTDDLVQAVNEPDLAVNFLVVLHGDAETLMGRLCRRIPGFDSRRVDLAAADHGTDARPSSPAGGAAWADRSGAVDGARPAGASALAAGLPADDVSQPAGGAAAASSPPASRQSATPPWQAQAARQPLRWLQWLALPTAAAGVLFFIEPAPEAGRESAFATNGGPADEPGRRAAGTVNVRPAPAPARSQPQAPSPSPRQSLSSVAFPVEASPATPSRHAPAVPPPLRLEIATPMEATTDRRLVGELAQEFARTGGVEIGVLPSLDWSASLHGAGADRLAIVRYDALQAARPAANGTRLEIVAPLHTDAIAVLVPASSRLRFIHEIEGRRVDIGPAGSAGSGTASALYRRLFGRPLPPDRTSALPPAAALQALLAGPGVEAMVVVGPLPASLEAQWAQGGLRLLALDPGHPASRRALQAFLPATLRWPDGSAREPATPTLAVMSFLVGQRPASAGEADRLTAFAKSLCRALPALQREGDPAWQTVQPALRLETGWPYSRSAATGLNECSSPGRPRPDAAAQPGRPSTPFR